ncbi:MAG: hypothetical protein H0W83_08035 [Planctomycetes bacterium]|nr:hypothetical protein [Planctomycetota bacterium]
MIDPAAFSIRGRFCFEQLVGRTWKSHDGEDLPEGAVIRSWTPPEVAQTVMP